MQITFTMKVYAVAVTLSLLYLQTKQWGGYNRHSLLLGLGVQSVVLAVGVGF